MGRVSVHPFRDPARDSIANEYVATVDRRDPDELVTWYTDDATFRFANQPPVVGKAAITAALRECYGRIASMRHERTGAWADATSGAFEAIAHFTTPDGRTFALPAVSTMRLRDGRIHEFRFAMDATPILGAGGADSG